MPSAEHEPGALPPEQPATKQGELPYHLASRFLGEVPAGRAYRRIRDMIYGSEQALSVFRIQLRTVYHVAVVGDPPPEPFERRLRRVLAAGLPVELPADILDVLYERRAVAQQEGSWVERRFPPGQTT